MVYYLGRFPTVISSLVYTTPVVFNVGRLLTIKYIIRNEKEVYHTIVFFKTLRATGGCGSLRCPGTRDRR